MCAWYWPKCTLRIDLHNIEAHFFYIMLMAYTSNTPVYSHLCEYFSGLLINNKILVVLVVNLVVDSH